MGVKAAGDRRRRGREERGRIVTEDVTGSETESTRRAICVGPNLR